ncbi:hypothetical protein CEUSTIGMA_g11919.t1 [Chlamydomonas eustigma]|uniref:RNase H type-1 domain-containing protein n=1 Tax=Chlamydomonas eustigma TaxID=1157962 RepID=A0A250XNH3_9CHLO|nr:hypothetical protein CEUSTIGMA_g11919.t1 [Chlamydomonas eustigma]|eukprot:GAX84499.1 hypothetical protein CEUSTIGMA_g11919.t1 [Chlamydomonas eustigma]
MRSPWKASCGSWMVSIMSSPSLTILQNEDVQSVDQSRRDDNSPMRRLHASIVASIVASSHHLFTLPSLVGGVLPTTAPSPRRSLLLLEPFEQHRGLGNAGLDVGAVVAAAAAAIPTPFADLFAPVLPEGVPYANGRGDDGGDDGGYEEGGHREAPVDEVRAPDEPGLGEVDDDAGDQRDLDAPEERQLFGATRHPPEAGRPVHRAFADGPKDAQRDGAGEATREAREHGRDDDLSERSTSGREDKGHRHRLTARQPAADRSHHDRLQDGEDDDAYQHEIQKSCFRVFTKPKTFYGRRTQGDSMIITDVYCAGKCHHPGTRRRIGTYVAHPEPGPSSTVAHWTRAPDTTSQAMELQSILLGLQLLVDNGATTDSVKIHTASKYVVKCMSSWMQRWRISGFVTKLQRPVKHCSLMRQISELFETTKADVVYDEFQHSDGILKAQRLLDNAYTLGRSSCFTRRSNMMWNLTEPMSEKIGPDSQDSAT